MSDCNSSLTKRASDSARHSAGAVRRFGRFRAPGLPFVLALVGVLVLGLGVACTASSQNRREGEAKGKGSPSHSAQLATVVSDVVDGEVREVVFSNGLRLLMKEDHSAPVATFVVYYLAGSRNEHVGNTGSSHLLEHLLFKGSERFPGRDTIMNTLSGVGASFNATTYYDRTNYYATVPSNQLPLVIELEGDRMRNATFSDADRASEMTVVRNELERGENNPGRVLSHQLWATSIIAHPYHHPVIGWRSDVENVPTSQLRSYYDQYYQPNNAVVAVVGDFNSNQVVEQVREHFGRYEKGPEVPEVYTVEEPQRGEKRLVIRKPGEVSIVKLGWLLPEAMHEDTVPLKVLQLILSGSLDVNEFGDPLSPGIGNRLYQALVETQLATSAGMSYVLMINPSLGSLTAYVRPEVEHQQVEDALREQVAKLQNEKVSEAELRRAKGRARAAFGLSQDGTFGQAMALGYFGLIGDWRFVRDFADRVEAVTVEDVQRVAQKYFHDDALTVGWYVPQKEGEGTQGEGNGKGNGPSGLFDSGEEAEAFGASDGAVDGSIAGASEFPAAFESLKNFESIEGRPQRSLFAKGVAQLREVDDFAEAREVELRAIAAQSEGLVQGPLAAFAGSSGAGSGAVSGEVSGAKAGGVSGTPSADRSGDASGAPAEASAEASADGATQAGSGTGVNTGAESIQRKTLSNGLRILVQENPSRATFALSGAVFAGSAFEALDQAGIAGVTADMLERGTTRRSKLQLAESLEEVGASLGIGGGFVTASIGGLALGEDLDRVLEVLAEQLLHPAFPADELEKLKAQRVARIRQAEDSTSTKGRRALYQGIYPPDHPRWVRDPEVSIAAINAIDEKALRSWYQSYWGPDRTVITVVGNVRAEEVFRLLEERLGDWKPVGGRSLADLEQVPVKVRESAGREVVFVPEKSNVDIFMGQNLPIQRTEAEWYPAMLGNHVLGGGTSGRLFTTIRGEMGLTYGIYSSIPSSSIPGPWTVSLTVNPQVVDQSLSAVNALLDKWQREGVTQEELDHAKASLVGRYKVGLASNSGLAGSLTAFEVLGLGADFVYRHPGLIEEVSLEEVNEAIRTQFSPETLFTVISGTWEESQESQGEE